MHHSHDNNISAGISVRVLRRIHDSTFPAIEAACTGISAALHMQAVAAERQAVAAERRAVAAERLAAAEERRAKAAEDQAIAADRRAFAAERQAGAMENIAATLQIDASCAIIRDSTGTQASLAWITQLVEQTKVTVFGKFGTRFVK